MVDKIKLSATRINSFLSCKQKYWFSYYEKLPKVSNTSFMLGLAVHESLELAGNIWLKEGKFSTESVKKILEHYDRVAVREGLEDMTLHAEGKDLVKMRLKKFVTGKRIISLETKFGFGKDTKTIETKDGVQLIGAIDKAEEYNIDTLLIIDYKTSKTAPTPDQMRSDIQLSIYDLVAKKLWPGYKRTILALDLLKSEVLFTYRTDDERESFEDYLKIVHEEMLDLKAGNVKATINMFCPWCDYKDYCNTYQSICKKKDYVFLPTMHYEDSQLIDEWRSVKATSKILDSRDRELSMAIMEKIKKESKNLVAGSDEVYVRQSSKTSYDFDTVHKMVPSDDFNKLVNLNKKAVDEYLALNPSIREAILETSTTNYTTPFLAYKTVKDKIKIVEE